MEIEPHITATVEKIPDDELRPLLAAMLVRLVMLDGPGFTGHQFPVIGTHWTEPPRWSAQ